MRNTMIFIVMIISIVYSQSCPPDVERIVTANLNGKDLFSSFAKYKEEIGFETNDNIGNVEAEACINFYIFDMDSIKSYSSNKQVSRIIQKTNNWFVPFSVNHNYRCLLEVGIINGEYVSYQVGWAQYAREIEAIRKEWEINRGFDVAFIMDAITQRLYFHIARQNETNLTEISVTVNGGENGFQKSVTDYGELGDAATIVPEIKSNYTQAE